MNGSVVQVDREENGCQLRGRQVPQYVKISCLLAALLLCNGVAAAEEDEGPKIRSAIAGRGTHLREGFWVPGAVREN